MNVVTAITKTVITTIARTRPNAPPNTRSTHRNPTSSIAQRLSLPAIFAITTTRAKMVTNAAIFAIDCDFTYGANDGAKRQYSHAANKYPTTVPASENISKKKPWAAATNTETR